MTDISNSFVQIQPSLVNLFKDYSVYIDHPKTHEIVQFVSRSGGMYSENAVQELIAKGIKVFVNLKDHKEKSHVLEQQLVEYLKGPIDDQKAVVIKDMTIHIVNEFFAYEAIRGRDSKMDGQYFDRVQRMSEYYVGLLDLENSEDVLKILQQTILKDMTTSTHSVNLMILALRYVNQERKLRRQKYGVPINFIGNEQAIKSKEERVAKSWALGALLHDIGKIQIPDTILKADRKLDDMEFNIMKTHVELGLDAIQNMADRLEQDSIVKAAILDHHERMDGSGYPSRSTEVSVVGRVIGLLDCYEALTTDKRPYRDAATPHEALSIILGDTVKGKFDSVVFKKVVELLANDEYVHS